MDVSLKGVEPVGRLKLCLNVSCLFAVGSNPFQDWALSLRREQKSAGRVHALGYLLGNPAQWVTVYHSRRRRLGVVARIGTVFLAV